MKPQQLRRKNIRLYGYDYSHTGAYFVTIVTQDRIPYFGEIIDRTVAINEVRIMIDNWWNELPEKFPNIILDQYIIMPNHLHGIIMIQSSIGERPTLSKIVQWFKTMSTNAYISGVKTQGWSHFNKRFWHRNYYEHIIRDDDDLDNIRAYIIDNPLNWKKDEENPKLV